MLICTIITLIRIRKSRFRIRSSSNQRRTRNIDRHLITILFVQIGLGILFTFFRCGFLVYTFSTNIFKKNSSQINLDLFLDKFSLLIYYLNFAKSFPINILTSQIFRHMFFQKFTFLLIDLLLYKVFN